THRPERLGTTAVAPHAAQAARLPARMRRRVAPASAAACHIACPPRQSRAHFFVPGPFGDRHADVVVPPALAPGNLRRCEPSAWAQSDVDLTSLHDCPRGERA